MNSQAKSLLRLYRDNAREIERLEDELAHWRSRAEKVTASYSLVPGHIGQDRIQLSVDETTALCDELNRRLCETAAQRRQAQRAIDGVPDMKLRRLLSYRYIDGLNLREVAEQMHLEYRWVRRLHQEALSSIDPRKTSATCDIV